MARKATLTAQYPRAGKPKVKNTGKNVSVVDETAREYPVYLPDAKEQEVVSAIFYKFRTTADERNRQYEYFDGLGLIDYIDDSVRRFVTNVDERDNIEDWQARIFDPFTRNKVLSIHGKIVQVLPVAQVMARGDEDIRKASLLSNLYQYAEDLDDYEELAMQLLLEAIVKGTAIGFEGIERKTKIVKNVKNFNDEITFTPEKTTTTRLFGSIVKLEDFYPSNVGIRRIKDMPFCFWRTIIPYQSFLQDWGMFEQAKWVQPKAAPISQDLARPFYVDYISQNVPEGSVEVIRYYNADVDEYVIMANAVWLNPLITNKEGKKEISPLPFDHKQLPFYEIKFDVFGSDFFYGKSLPDRLKSLQDVLNVLTNMLLDQSFLTVFPPLLTAGFDPIEDDFIRPGRRTPVDTQGLPLDKAFMKLDLGTPTGWHQWITEYTRKVMEQSSSDQLSQGVAGIGGRTTAHEIDQAAMGVASMLQMFARFVNYGLKRKAYFKCANILQFWTDKNSPMIEQVLGEGGTKAMADAFNTFRVDNTVLSSGMRGTQVIELYSDKSKMPTKKQLKNRSMISRLKTGKKIEYIAIDPDYIRDFQFDVKLVASGKNPTSQDIEKALQLEKVRTYLSFFPNLVNLPELAAETAEKMGDDPTKVLLPDVFQSAKDAQPNAPEAPGEGPAAPVGGKPQGNQSSTQIQKATAQPNQLGNVNDLSKLQASLLG